MSTDKPLVWLRTEVKTPPFSSKARLECGYWLRKLQQGENLSLPISRPMSNIGSGCHELRIVDENVTWRVVYRVDNDCVVIAHVFKKKTPKTPNDVIELCQKRLRHYDRL